MGKHFFEPGEKYKLYRGDCLKLSESLPGKIADMVFTDPPYNLDEDCSEIHIKGREGLSKTAAWDKDFDPGKLIEPLQGLCKPTSNAFAFTSFNVFGDWYRIYNPLYDTFQFMVWKKTNPSPQVRKSSVLNACEQIVMFWNKGHKWNFTTQNEMHNYVESPICMGKERVKHSKTGKTLHPTQKPLKALTRQILWCTDPGDVVLDFYAGVASIGVAALSLGRRYIGFELDPTYYAAAKIRLEAIANQPTVEQCLTNPWAEPR